MSLKLSNCPCECTTLNDAETITSFLIYIRAPATCCCCFLFLFNKVTELLLFWCIFSLSLLLSKGICGLFAGDIDTAETYLQLAARWAQQQQPAHQIIALSNLGDKLGSCVFVRLHC